MLALQILRHVNKFTFARSLYNHGNVTNQGQTDQFPNGKIERTRCGNNMLLEAGIFCTKENKLRGEANVRLQLMKVEKSTEREDRT